MRNIALVALGFSLLVLQAALAALVPIYQLSPNLLLPIVIYLGVSHDVSIWRGAVLAFCLGYLLDSFCGSPMGLQTLVMVATFISARGAGLRLVLRGPLFQVGLTFVVGVLAGGAILALRAIFEKPPPFPAGGVADNITSVTVPAVVTSLLAPLVFAVVQRIERISVRGREEGASAA